MKLKEAYAYNDVSLVPAYSELKSRSEANPEMHGYSLPIIASCMDTLGKEVLSECVKYKLPFICHRSFKSAKEQFEYFMGNPATYYHNYDKCIWFAVGSVQKYQDWIEYLYERGVRRFCVDMAHGDSKACVDTIEFIKNYDIKKKKEAVINGHYMTSLGGADIPVHVIAGNVASLSGFKRLQKAGADGVRVGIASGSICFLPDTEVTVRGSGNNIYYRPMQFMSKGDFVLTHKGRIRQVKDVIISDYSGEIYLVNKKTRCTPNHPFYVYNIETKEKSWIPIKDIDLRIHRFISGEGGKQLNNCTISIDEYSGKVYNLTVDEDESYCVGKRRMIVHNCSTQLNCFPGDTLVNTFNGKKKIKDLQKDDIVLCHDGTFQKIVSTLSRKYDGSMIEINGQLSTPNHQYFVVNKVDKDKITNENYLEYGYWIEASKLTKEHMLIKLDE